MVIRQTTGIPHQPQIKQERAFVDLLGNTDKLIDLVNRLSLVGATK